MGAVSLSTYEQNDDKHLLMEEYLSADNSYWLKNDKWYIQSKEFQNSGLNAGMFKKGRLADFSGYRNEGMKLEMKYYLLYSMRNKQISPFTVYNVMTTVIRLIGINLAVPGDNNSFNGMNIETLEWSKDELSECVRERYMTLKRNIVRFITDFFDERDEFEKDVWQALNIPGVNISAAAKRQKSSMNFDKIPEYYREMVKRFLSRLVIKRSWSYSQEMLMYIRYFFKVFYDNGYLNGFLKQLSRQDIEKYLCWVAADYKDKNATFRSKAVSFIRQYIDYIQLAEYSQAPMKDINRLILEDDIPKRERYEDTMAKVKYIPEPIRVQLDRFIHEIERKEMIPVYILLRESGWRGTDVLNLRCDSCLEYLWNDYDKRYIPYLCGEITKTGIPLLKIPIREEIADMVKKLSDEATSISTEENNPDHYLFKTYEGKFKGLPYSKQAFSAAVQQLINRKGIIDGDGKLYRFKAHSLRHTRAMEFTEQGMPIGIIQQVLGHCSLQMTLHYSKVSENILYNKWKQTEKLNLLHLDSKPPNHQQQKEEDIHYEYIRKNLDAVRVPFGVCFKPSKLPCRQQMNHCLDCANFCTSRNNITEYEKEIKRVKEQLETSKAQGRNEWIDKNSKYLENLEKMLERIQKEGTIHKNGGIREEYDG